MPRTHLTAIDGNPRFTGLEGASVAVVSARVKGQLDFDIESFIREYSVAFIPDFFWPLSIDKHR